MGVNVCVVGATGNVGRTMIKILEEQDFPVDRIRFLASSRSAGKKLPFKDAEIVVEELSQESFKKGELVLSSPGSSVSKWYVPSAVRSGAVVIDNTSAFRMDRNVPLVVPEVNPQEALKHKGIIANPNCSTIQMVVVLKPIHDVTNIRRVVVSTYQAVSGAGMAAIKELKEGSQTILNGRSYKPSVFPHQIAFNCIPQIPQKKAFCDNFYTEEEMKMVNETKKIMKDYTISITATAVRVPVFTSHSEAVNVETERKLSRSEITDILFEAPGIVVQDEPENEHYPNAARAAGKNKVYVGRIREDISHPCAFDLWIVSDNLRKGAAFNAVQIAELLL